LHGANLSKADLSEADLRWADLSGVNLRLADLHGANLSKADLRWADLRWADLSWADLREANLSKADLREANLRGADLREANGRFSIVCFGKHYGVAAGGYISIGCERHTYQYWLDNYRQIGEKNQYADADIERYGAWIKIVVAWLEERG
jgi:uncharacterized protein YjbI with pentapeptide repeats